MPQKHLILYDGVCGLCNAFTKFVLARDRLDKFRFASLQSRLARDVLKAYGKDPSDLDTVYLIGNYGAADEFILAKGRAALRVLWELGGFWRVSALGKAVPSAVLDRGYDFVAGLRYRLFGKAEACIMPDARHSRKFLDI